MPAYWEGHRGQTKHPPTQQPANQEHPIRYLPIVLATINSLALLSIPVPSFYTPFCSVLCCVLSAAKRQVIVPGVARGNTGYEGGREGWTSRVVQPATAAVFEAHRRLRPEIASAKTQKVLLLFIEVPRTDPSLVSGWSAQDSVVRPGRRQQQHHQQDGTNREILEDSGEEALVAADSVENSRVEQLRFFLVFKCNTK